ncbi:MAG: hypothetical protein GXC73_19140 [Chitinophagaceae bacterium]|nr:hypothetical protein [Chitinophagaceae bacterium]
MLEPLKVTFDKNVYEFVVNPNKETDISDNERAVFRLINGFIVNGRILPFISETCLTYEAVAKKERIPVLAHRQPILVKSEGMLVTISSNPNIFPGNHFKDDIYLKGAIDLGFKILPGKRFGKLINPNIKTEWYYYLNEDYFETSERYGKIADFIEEMGGGYTQYLNLITTLDNKHLNTNEKLKLFRGNIKHLSAAVAEWSDGDSVALHIAYGLDYFCTYDEGKNAKPNSTLGQPIYNRLNQKFGFNKVKPEELSRILGN